MNRTKIKGATASRSYRNRLKKLREGQREAQSLPRVEDTPEPPQATQEPPGGLRQDWYRVEMN